MSRRSERRDQFRGSGDLGQSFSPNLIVSARILLDLALQERRGGVFRQRENHWTQYATSVVVLAVTALDAWMTEFALTVEPFNASMREFCDRPLATRFVDLLERYGKAEGELASELRTLVDVRDEIVHFLPRRLGPGYPLPKWLQSLDDRGLMISAGEFDFRMGQKLESYALAYWACEVVANCVQQLVAAIPDNALRSPEWTANNFYRFRFITAPRELPAFDSVNGLELTR